MKISSIHLFSLSLLVLMMIGCASHKPAGARGSQDGVNVAAMSEGALNRYRTSTDELRAGKAEQAEGKLRALSTEYPGHLGVWVNLATACFDLGKLEEAEEALTRAAQIGPRNAETHNLRGLTAVERGDYPAAEEHYRVALAVNPDHAEAHYNLALIYDLFHQDPGRALPHYERYLSLLEHADPETAAWADQLRASLEREAKR